MRNWVRIHECAGQVAPPQTHYKMRGNQRFQSANRRRTSLASGICGIASRWPIDICSHRRPFCICFTVYAKHILTGTILAGQSAVRCAVDCNPLVHVFHLQRVLYHIHARQNRRDSSSNRPDRHNRHAIGSWGHGSWGQTPQNPRQLPSASTTNKTALSRARIATCRMWR